MKTRVHDGVREFTCHHCQLWLPAENFPKKPTGLYGIRGVCRECIRYHKGYTRWRANGAPKGFVYNPSPRLEKRRRFTETGDEEFYCSACKLWHPRAVMKPRSSAPFGVISRCLPCARKQNRELKARKRELKRKRIARARERRAA